MVLLDVDIAFCERLLVLFHLHAVLENCRYLVQALRRKTHFVDHRVREQEIGFCSQIEEKGFGVYGY